eukprot:3747963-Pyramimonas_sp.AAC.1
MFRERITLLLLHMRCGQMPRLRAQLALSHKPRPPATEPQRLRGGQRAGLNPSRDLHRNQAGGKEISSSMSV